MKEWIKVAVDAMGGDHAPDEIVKGAIEAIQKNGNILIFQQHAIQRCIKQRMYECGISVDIPFLQFIDQTALPIVYFSRRYFR